MKHGLYLRLALQGMGKNKKIYFPYLLASSGCAMMSYIVLALSSDKDLANIKGGSTAQMALSMGSIVVLLFSLIFLLYTSSFLMKQRRREFGLLNILGMDKGNLSRVMLWESLFSYAVTMVLGIGLGVLFTKLCILLLFQMLGQIPVLNFTISIPALKAVLECFAGIFLLLLGKNLLQVRLSKPIDLLHSVNTGEKQPKANYLLAILGIASLAAGYYIAVTTDSVSNAFNLFFIAVLFVIAGTYLCFISASVAILKLLKKSKRYYYRSNHFVSVSNMIFRMRRNGAGLASICIILTMILVMLSSTLCLRLGCEDALRTRFPEQFRVEAYAGDDFTTDLDPKKAAEDFLSRKGLTPTKLIGYTYDCAILGKEGNVLRLVNSLTGDSQNVTTFLAQVMSLQDFNTRCDKDETLASDEVLLVGKRSLFPENTLDLDGVAQYRVKDIFSTSNLRGEAAILAANACYVVLPTQADVDAFRLYAQEQCSAQGADVYFIRYAVCGFDLDLTDSEQETLFREMDAAIDNMAVECRALDRMDFLALYGGLLFLGLLLGLTFLMAAVLIIYYKQVSEGYEDAGRFRILMDVGMTDREIRKSINSQLLTVFFLPLLVAALHTAFALPIISLLLTGFGFHNTLLYYLISGGVFLLTCLLYTAIYSATSRTYYNIVKSGAT